MFNENEENFRRTRANWFIGAIASRRNISTSRVGTRFANYYLRLPIRTLTSYMYKSQEVWRVLYSIELGRRCGLGALLAVPDLLPPRCVHLAVYAPWCLPELSVVAVCPAHAMHCGCPLCGLDLCCTCLAFALHMPCVHTLHVPFVYASLWFMRCITPQHCKVKTRPQSQSQGNPIFWRPSGRKVRGFARQPPDPPGTPHCQTETSGPKNTPIRGCSPGILFPTIWFAERGSWIFKFLLIVHEC